MIYFVFMWKSTCFPIHRTVLAAATVERKCSSRLSWRVCLGASFIGLIRSTRLVIWVHLLNYPSDPQPEILRIGGPTKAPWALNAQNVGDRIQMGHKSFGASGIHIYLLREPLNEFIDATRFE